ncbi:CPP1-like family protein [Leptothermofonsia sp. ETS-13]|uniref:CPP1-like family protein n=1 Tax=Leptothermofonsia sp. ETS-13 TaxID=3035696 RepID=UPI003BA11F9C
MSGQNPYEQLGVTEASSFEEIQDARNRLFAQHQGDHKQLELIEAAYDAVLMDRLRLRQEGKIKVPDRIRFPEKMIQSPPSPTPTQAPNSPNWLQSLVDTPSRIDILLPAVILAILSALIIFYNPSSPAGLQQVLQASLVVGGGSSFYFLFRKERKLGRSVLLSLVGLIGGLILGYLLGTALQAQLLSIGIRPDIFATVVTFFILWLISSFLR